jgi:hypothetical protein
MTMTVPPVAAVSPSRPFDGRAGAGSELPLPPGAWLEAPLWLLAGVEDDEITGAEPHIWRGID